MATQGIDLKKERNTATELEMIFKRAAAERDGTQKKLLLERSRQLLRDSDMIRELRQWNEIHKQTGYPAAEFERDLKSLLKAEAITEYHASVLRELKEITRKPRGNGDAGARVFRDISTVPIRKVFELTCIVIVAVNPFHRSAEDTAKELSQLIGIGVRFDTNRDHIDVVLSEEETARMGTPRGAGAHFWGWLMDILGAAADGGTLGAIIGTPFGPGGVGLGGLVGASTGAILGAVDHEMQYHDNNGFMTDPNDPNNPCNTDPFIYC